MLLIALAFATSNFPSALESDLAMPCTPACTVCHTTNGGGGGTVTQPFGVELTSRGMTASNEQKLSDALTQMAADGVDSDGDGLPDTEALAQGIEPNTGASFCGSLLPKYGCLGGASGGAAGLLLLPALFRRRS